MKEPSEIILTVCVAAYQVEEFIRECLDSIVGQLEPGVEVLVIDDASQDGTERISRSYEQSVDALRVIRLETNMGSSGVRNRGIEEAKGKWMLYIDGDDLLLPGAIRTLLSYKNDPADIVVFDSVEFDDSKRIPIYCPKHGEFVIDSPEDLLDYRHTILGGRQFGKAQYRSIPFVSVWGKLLRIAFLREHHMKFDLRLRQAQDLQFTFSYSRFLKKAHFLPAAIYGYRNNSVGGVTKRYSEKIVQRDDLLMNALKETLAQERKESADAFQKAYYARALYEMTGPMIEQSIAHPDCPMSAKERRAWLKNMIALPWAQETIQMYSTLPEKLRTRYKTTVILLMKHKMYGLADIVFRVRIGMKRRAKV